MDTPVTKLDAAGKLVICGQQICGPFDGILPATGADPVVPPLGAIPGGRVLCTRTVADAKLLRERMESGLTKVLLNQQDLCPQTQKKSLTVFLRH